MSKVDICDRLRLAPANLIGTDDEERYWVCHDAAREIERLRLTDEEREAISRVYDLLCARPLIQWAKTLQGLWERLSGSAAISGAGKSVPAANTPPTLTDEEIEAIKRAIDSQQDRAAEMHSRSWTAAAIDEDCDTLRGMLGRLG
jgi:hypothetical protein